MGVFAQMLGWLMAAGGIAAVVYGGPYYMLEWGGTLVVSGAVVASAGLILVFLGVVIRQIAGARREWSALVAPSVAPAAAASTADPQPGQTTEPETAAGPAAKPAHPLAAPVGAAPAAGAAAAGGGLAVAARSILSSVSAQDEVGNGPAEKAHAEEAARPVAEVDDRQLTLAIDAGGPETPAREEDVAKAEPAEEKPAAPAASQEGVVAAYSVGGNSFTMYADGRIRAQMADGEHEFASMEELKAYMAERRLSP